MTHNTTIENTGGLLGLGSAVMLAIGAEVNSPNTMIGAIVIGFVGLMLMVYAAWTRN
jgi:hypothetical protein